MGGREGGGECGGKKGVSLGMGTSWGKNLCVLSLDWCVSLEVWDKCIMQY